MPTIDFERLDWEDYPSTETPLSAKNLNRLEDAMEGIYDDVGGQEQAISNILGNFAYVEPTAVASKDYLAGDLLVRGDYMYKAIIPIQTDDALVEGTNITKTTVSSELGVDVFSNFAYIERSNVATKNYTVGSHVLLNNILYVVTSAVETGENLVVDMNIEQTTVCDELEKQTGSVASAVGYDNTTSGLEATNVQDAVDELNSNMISQSVNDYLYYSDNLVFLHFCGYEISSQSETIYSLPAQYAPKKRMCAPIIVVGSTGNHYLGYVIIEANSTSVKSNAVTSYGTSTLVPVSVGNKLYGQIMWQC